MDAQADEIFEVFFMGGYPYGETRCPLEMVPESVALVAFQYYSNTLVVARGLAVTPDDMSECEPDSVPLAACGVLIWVAILSPSHPFIPLHSTV